MPKPLPIGDLLFMLQRSILMTDKLLSRRVPAIRSLTLQGVPMALSRVQVTEPLAITMVQSGT